jgi:hypothetical protein
VPCTEWCSGLFAIVSITGLCRRHVTCGPIRSVVVGLAFVVRTSELHDLAGWWIALAMSPEAAASCNDRHGYVFDAQTEVGIVLPDGLGGGNRVAMRSGGSRLASAEARTAQTVAIQVAVDRMAAPPRAPHPGTRVRSTSAPES